MNINTQKTTTKHKPTNVPAATGIRTRVCQVRGRRGLLQHILCNHNTSRRHWDSNPGRLGEDQQPIALNRSMPHQCLNQKTTNATDTPPLPHKIVPLDNRKCANALHILVNSLSFNNFNFEKPDPEWLQFLQRFWPLRVKNTQVYNRVGPSGLEFALSFRLASDPQRFCFSNAC